MRRLWRTTGSTRGSAPGSTPPWGSTLVRDVALVCLADGLVGLSFGATAVAGGLPWWVPVAMSLLVFAGGSQIAAVGVVLAGAKEVKNASLKNLKDVRAYTNLPVLSSIPLLENALLVRRKRRLAWLAWSSALIIGTVLISGAMYYHYVIVPQA